MVIRLSWGRCKEGSTNHDPRAQPTHNNEARSTCERRICPVHVLHTQCILSFFLPCSIALLQETLFPCPSFPPPLSSLHRAAHSPADPNKKAGLSKVVCPSLPPSPTLLAGSSSTHSRAEKRAEHRTSKKEKSSESGHKGTEKGGAHTIWLCLSLSLSPLPLLSLSGCQAAYAVARAC